MPAATVCAEPECPAIATHGGRCAQHQRQRPTTTTTAAGYGWRYQQQRAAFLASRPICQMCGARPATTVHHLRHDAATPAGLDTTFWVAACMSCNVVEANQSRTRRGTPSSLTP